MKEENCSEKNEDEIYDIKLVEFNNSKDSGWKGYTIFTKAQEITCLIENRSICCVTFGARLYFNDKVIHEFINAYQQGRKNRSLSCIGKSKGTYPKNLRVEKVRILPCTKNDNGEYIQAVNVEIKTNEGKLRVELFNESEGYYPGNIKISWKDFKIEEPMNIIY